MNPPPSPLLGSIALNTSPLWGHVLDVLHQWDVLDPQQPGQADTGAQLRRARQLQQFELLEVARYLYPEDQRLQNCHSVRVSAVAPVGVYALSWGGVAFGNLQTCGRSYCPVCGPRIRSRRGHELVAIAQAFNDLGFSILRVDWTHAHGLGTSLAEQVEGQRALFRVMSSGKRAFSQRLKRSGEYAGGRRALDYTYGASGHHLHAHSALFIKPAVSFDEVRDVICEAYGAAARQVGLYVGHAGVNVSLIDPEGARYLHKLGVVQVGRSSDSLIPVQLLSLASQGDAEAGKVWREFAQETRGLRTLSTTPGLTARVAQLVLAKDAQDGQLAQVQVPLGATLTHQVKHWDALRLLDTLRDTPILHGKMETMRPPTALQSAPGQPSTPLVGVRLSRARRMVVRPQGGLHARPNPLPPLTPWGQ